MNQPHFARLLEDEKIELADGFTRVYGPENLSCRDKDLLSECILNWNRTDCIRTLHPEQTLVRYRCDWASAKSTRRFLNSALNVRRANCVRMGSQCKQSAREVSRWYVLPWLSGIQNCEWCYKLPEIRSVEFGRQLAGVKHEFDMATFGLVQARSSRPISRVFSVKQCLLNGNSRFVSHTNAAGQPPWIEIDFGPEADFKVSAILIDCDSTRQDDLAETVPHAIEIDIETSQAVKRNVAKVDGASLPADEDRRLRRIEIGDGIRCRRITIRQIVDPGLLVNVMRVVRLDVVGRFSCKGTEAAVRRGEQPDSPVGLNPHLWRKHQ
jgi:hypothetical protein